MEKFSVKKPFTVLVMVLVIIILGFVSLTSMTTDLLPRINLPYMLVITTYPGASPEKVETTICEPMESALGSVKGVKNVFSISNENYGIVELEFQDGTDMDATMVKVSSALDPIKEILPDECGTPQLMELGTDMLASMYVAVAYDGKEIEQLSSFVEDTVVPRLERQDGVTNVSEIGLVEKTIQVELNKEKVDKLNDKILAKTDDAFADAVEKLDDAKKSLEDGQVELNKNKDKMNENVQKLEDSKQDLIDGQKELDDGKKELRDKQADLNEAQEQLDKGKEELQEQKDATIKQLAEASKLVDEINAWQARLDEIDQTLKVVKDFPEQIEKLEQGIDVVNSLISSLPDDPTEAIGPVLAGFINGTLSAAEIKQTVTEDTTVAEASALLNGILGSLTATKENLQSTYDALDVPGLTAEKALLKEYIKGAEAALKKMGMSYVEIEKLKMQAAAGFGSADAQMAAGQAQLSSAQAQLDAGKTSLEDAQKQLDDGWKSIDDAKEQLEEGKKSLEDAQKQIDDGWKDYEDAVKQYEKQKAQALKKANANQLISLDTLSMLIYAQNFAMPAGYVDDKKDDSWLVKVGENYQSLADLENVLLTKIDDIGDVRLCDVADLYIIDNADDSYAKLDGKDSVILSIFKGSTSGTNEVSKQCKAEIAAMEEEFPGLKVFVMMDQGDYITLIINSVLNNILIGALLAVVVLAIFLKDLMPTLVVAASIPLSVLTALILMYFTDISLNMMSLSGLALGIGMLVDNSIVVIENIYRLRTKGVSAARAAVQGTKQVAGAIVASTLTTVCVFFPMVFTTGTVRDLMMPISLTIIYTLTASLFIAMTVVPAAGSTVLRKSKEKKHPWFDKIQDVYGAILGFCLKVKIIPLVVAIALLALCIWQVARMGIVMFPDMSSNQIEASVNMPDDLDRKSSYAMADEIMERVMAQEEVASVGAMSGGDTALFSSGNGSSNFSRYSFMITMKNEKAGNGEVKQLCDNIEAACADLDCEISLSSGMSEMSAMSGSGLAINVYGSDLDTLQKICDDLAEIIGKVEGFEEVTTGQEEMDQVIHLILDKDAAMRYGLSVAQIFNDLNSKISSTKTATTITLDGEDMEIVLKDNRDPLMKENLLDYVFEVEVVDEDGDTILEDHKLGEFAKEKMEDGVQSIDRKNQSRYMTVTAMADADHNLTLLARDVEPIIKEYELPNGYIMEMGGEYDTVLTMVKQMAKVLALGLALIYLVMVAQFQSLLSPFIVIFTVPLAFTGGLIGLWIAGENLSITGLLGFVILMGTVVNNGIVFVDYTNQLRMGGLDRHSALIATGKTRMRPILMTALTTILAMSTMIFGDDMGSQMSKGMSIVIIGGLLYATLMTLFIIPVMYDILFKKQPLAVDIGNEDLDDVPDDAADFIAEQAASKAAE